MYKYIFPAFKAALTAIFNMFANSGLQPVIQLSILFICLLPMRLDASGTIWPRIKPGAHPVSPMMLGLTYCWFSHLNPTYLALNEIQGRKGGFCAIAMEENSSCRILSGNCACNGQKNPPGNSGGFCSAWVYWNCAVIVLVKPSYSTACGQRLCQWGRCPWAG